MKSKSFVAKRPLFFAAVFYLFGILAGANLRIGVFLYFTLGAVFLLGGIFLRKFPSGGWMILISLFFAAMASISFAVHPALPNIELSGYHMVEGRVSDISQKPDGVLYKLTDASIDRQKLGGGVFLKCPGGSYQLDGILSSEALVRIPELPEYPGAFDDAKYCAAKNVLYRAYSRQDESIGKADDVLAKINGIRMSIAGSMDELLGKEAPVAKAFLLGIVSDIDENVRMEFNQTGISHILSVSGLHVGIVVAAAYFLMKLLHAGRKATYFSMIALLLCYLFLTGCYVPVLRAAVMCFFWQTGIFFGKRTDSLTVLAAAFFVVVLPNPAVVFDVGFQLSFGAMFCIFCLTPIFAGWIRIRWKTLKNTLASTLAVTAGTLPILVNLNNYFWPLTIVVNIFAILYSAILIPAIAVLTILFCLFGSVFAWVGPIGSAMIGVLAWMAGLSGKFPELGFALPEIAGWIVFLTFCAVFLCSKYVHISSKIKAAGALCVVALAIASFLPSLPARQGVSIEFLNAAGGSAAIVYMEDGTEAMIDTGSGEGMATYVAQKGIYPEKTFLTQDADEAAGGMASLQEKNKTGMVYAAEQNVPAFSRKYGVAVNGLKTGDSVRLSERCEISAVYASDLYSGFDGSVMVLLLKVDGRNACLFLGDAARGYANLFTEGYSDTPIIKYNAAQKNYISQELLQLADPQYCIVTSGDYGSQGFYDALSGVKVYNTFDRGMIRVKIEDGIRVETTYGRD